MAAAELACRRAKKDTCLFVALYGASSDPVVGIPVADGDAIVLIFRKSAGLYQAVGDAPAEEQALTVAASDAIAEDWALGAAARVKAELGIIFRATIFKAHIVAHLKAEAIAIVVARLHVSEGQPAAVLRKYTAGIVAVKVFIIRPVAIKRDILNGHVLHVLTVQDREKRRRRRISGKPEVLAQAGIELESVPAARHQRALDHRVAPVIRIFCAQANAVAHLEPLGVLQRDFLVVPVAVIRELHFH